MSQFGYVKVLRNQGNREFYVGFAAELKRRLAEHNVGEVESMRK